MPQENNVRGTTNRGTTNKGIGLSINPMSSTLNKLAAINAIKNTEDLKFLNEERMNPVYFDKLWKHYRLSASYTVRRNVDCVDAMDGFLRFYQRECDIKISLPHESKDNTTKVKSFYDDKIIDRTKPEADQAVERFERNIKDLLLNGKVIVFRGYPLQSKNPQPSEEYDLKPGMLVYTAEGSFAADDDEYYTWDNRHIRMYIGGIGREVYRDWVKYTNSDNGLPVYEEPKAAINKRRKIYIVLAVFDPFVNYRI